MILVIVPAAVEKGFVTLKTPEGDIVSKTQFNLKVAVTVTAIVPTGTSWRKYYHQWNYLNWVNRITFARDKNVTAFVSKTINQLVVKVPMMPRPVH